jgi:hypothetical protein
MYIVRQQKKANPSKDGQDDSSILDNETVINIRGLMDEHVFDLLDRTELKVLSMQKHNQELLEELTQLFIDQMSSNEQALSVYDIMTQLHKLVEDLLPNRDPSTSESLAPL